MRPKNFTAVNDKIIYHHTFTDLRKFLEHGFKEGNNGFILVGQHKDFLMYKGFGTIEAPCKTLRTVEVQHCPIFDGEMLKPEEVVNPPKKSQNLFTTVRLEILDLKI